MLPLAYLIHGTTNLWGGGRRIIVEEGAVICAGAKILAKDKIVIGKGTIIGANSVLTCSTGDNEIWAGIPARFIRKR